MFRTFRSNPALGGFGSESSSSELHDDASTPDAFCQIIKEFVDNAIDACSVPSASDQSQTKENKSTERNGTIRTTAKRVRVVIQRFNDTRDSQDGSNDINMDSSSRKEILRVTVSDNGCGMADIQTCVDAFHTSKAHSSNESVTALLNKNGSKNKRKEETKKPEPQTAGRYGIGLTLCLLHAQRLVPDSCASIQSAVASDSEWTSVTAVVDTASDTIRCFARKSIKKTNPSESGTSISVLVPGGSSATLAWPRLAEYFARFKLSMGMTCSVEVLAPTLSRIPLMVQPLALSAFRDGVDGPNRNATKPIRTTQPNREVDLFHGHDLDDAISDSESDGDREANVPSKERLAICEATRRFLGRHVNVANVAHIRVPIRSKDGKKTKQGADLGPTLEVDVIVHGPDDDDDISHEYDSDEDESTTDKNGSVGQNAGSLLYNDSMHEVNSSASMVLIRMVNKIPLLDSSEAAACGLVLGLSSKKRMWNSFGLEVSMKHDAAKVDKLPTFVVSDSEQVAPFLKKGAHELFENVNVTSRDESDEVNRSGGSKRKKEQGTRSLRPASIRLGNILVIAQIHAKPTMLPLPSLSKGRLPIDNKAIDDALELGMTLCLRQLQTTNADLLLTASELRLAERDSRYVPAFSMALASMLVRSSSCTGAVQQIMDWESSQSGRTRSIVPSCRSRLQPSIEPDGLGKLIEERLRMVLTAPRKSTSKKRKGSGKANEVPSLDILGHDSVDVTLVSSTTEEDGEEMVESAVSSMYIQPSPSNRIVGKSRTTTETDYDDWL